MYKFFYWFFYKFFIWRKGFESSFLASSMVGLAFILHLIFIFTVIQFLTAFTFVSPFSVYNYSTREIMLLPIVLIFFLILDKLYFRRKRNIILEKYYLENPFTKQRILLVILTLLVPLVLSIWLNKLIHS